MSHNIKTKTNEELIKLISDAAAELEWRRKANEATANIQGDPPPPADDDEGGDHPPVSKFP